MSAKHHPNYLIKRNLTILSLVYFFIYLLPYTPISVIIFEKLTGSYALAMSVFALMRLSLSFFEIPTGVLSDKWGRRKSLIVGSSFCFISVVFLCFALHSKYSLCFLYGAGISQALAQALHSGNNEAFLYETLISLKCSHQYPKAIGRMNSMTQAGLFVSALLSAFILFGGFSYDALIYVSLATSLALTLCSMFVIEPPRKEKSEEHSLRHIATAFKQIQKNKRLMLYSLVSIFQTGSAETSYLFSPSFIGSVWSMSATTLYRAGQHLIGTISFWYAGSFVKKLDIPIALIGTPFFIYGVWLIACWINNAASPVIVLLAPIFFSIWQTAKSTLEQTSFTPKQRATMGSLLNLGSSIITAILCLIVGLLADYVSINIALFIMISVSAVIVISGYMFTYKKHK